MALASSNHLTVLQNKAKQTNNPRPSQTPESVHSCQKDPCHTGMCLRWAYFAPGTFVKEIKFLYPQHQPLSGILAVLLWEECSGLQRKGDTYQAGECRSLLEDRCLFFSSEDALPLPQDQLQAWPFMHLEIISQEGRRFL